MENNNYNIKLNPKNLSSEDIASHKNFDALLAQATAATSTGGPSFGLKSLYYLVGGIAAALLGFFLISGLVGDQPMTTEEYLASQPYVNPPMENIDQKCQSGQMDANQGGEYVFENGSKVIVPAAAFVDQNGQVVSGEVDIKYREFHDFVDFFLSGIPMEYDSSGTVYNLESSGMVEIYAEQNGQRLSMAPNKSINIELVSEIMTPANDRANAPQFNIYQLDENKRNWVYQGRDDIEILEEDLDGLLIDEEMTPEMEYEAELQDIESREVSQLAEIEATIPKPATPMKPERANGSDYVFNFDFEENDRGGEQTIGQLQDNVRDLQRQYANTLWQVAPGQPDFNEEMVSQIAWEDMKLVQKNGRDYELTLINPNKTLTVTVNPVLSSADYNTALNKFNQAFSEYRAELQQREQALEAQKEEIAKLVAIEREAANARYEEKLEIYRKNGREDMATDLMIKNRIVNRFSVSSLGVWNCDRPLPPFANTLNGKFIDNHDQKYQSEIAYLVDKSRNTVYRFKTKPNTRVNYNFASENMIWIINKENKLALFMPEKFKNIDNKAEDFTFVMDLQDQPVTSEEQIRAILNF